MLNQKEGDIAQKVIMTEDEISPTFLPEVPDRQLTWVESDWYVTHVITESM